MKKITYIIIALSLLLTSCGGGKDSDPVAVQAPVAAALSFPAQNELCTQGTPVSVTQSTLVFKWAASANTDSYELILKNLLTGTTTTQIATQNQLSLNVNVNTPYAWYVTSKSTKTTTVAQSNTWKFYNSGPGAVAYAPFPAEIIGPLTNQSLTSVNGKITLTWNGNDVDNDIISYDVYFGTTALPPLLKKGVTDTKYDVDVISEATYYWKIITTDSKGNISDSGVSYFLAK